jgi:lysophospholipase L1-like esterase
MWPPEKLSSTEHAAEHAGMDTAAGLVGMAIQSSAVSNSWLGTDTQFSGGSRASTCWQITVPLPCGVDSVQICPTADVADVSSYTGVKYSVQATDGTDTMNPHPGKTMVAVTFAGAASPTFPSGASGYLPAGQWSDWIPVQNTGAAPCALIVRGWYPAGVAAGGGYASGAAVNGVTWAQKMAALGAFGQLYYAGSDKTADNGAAMTILTASMPVMVRIATRKRVPSIWLFGDSTRQGWYADGRVSAVDRWAISESAAGRPTAGSTLGITGQTTTQYLARLKALVAAGDRCDVLVWQVASPNNGLTDSALLAAQIGHAHEAIGIAAKMDARVILDGPFPMATGTPSAAILGIVSGARQFCNDMNGVRSGITSCLYEGLHDPANYGAWVTAYNYSNDGLHPNELATTSVILPQLSAALKSALGR